MLMLGAVHQSAANDSIVWPIVCSPFGNEHTVAFALCFISCLHTVSLTHKHALALKAFSVQGGPAAAGAPCAQ